MWGGDPVPSDPDRCVVVLYQLLMDWYVSATSIIHTLTLFARCSCWRCRVEEFCVPYTPSPNKVSVHSSSVFKLRMFTALEDVLWPLTAVFPSPSMHIFCDVIQVELLWCLPARNGLSMLLVHVFAARECLCSPARDVLSTLLIYEPGCNRLFSCTKNGYIHVQWMVSVFLNPSWCGISADLAWCSPALLPMQGGCIVSYPCYRQSVWVKHDVCTAMSFLLVL